MLHAPRVALGTVDGDVDIQPLLWALVEVGQRLEFDIQTFDSQARFPEHDGVAVVTGQRKRHLDSWLMSQDVCREIFCHSARSADLSLVVGAYDAAKVESDGGSLDTLCRWLDLSQLVVLDAARLRQGLGSHRPADVAGVLIDNVADRSEACRLKTMVEALWGVPVLGMLDELPAVRAIIGGLRLGCAPSRELCRALAARLWERMDFELLLKIAAGKPFPPVVDQLFQQGPQTPLNVAVAFDDAFQCYFQDTLDMLDMRGASIRDFSPLKDERLPADTDVVYIGCGHPEYHAAALSANHCMLESLRMHARSGRRVFAEGGGLAYLAEQLQIDPRRKHAMAGLLPMTAHVNSAPAAPAPIRIRVAHDCWLGQASTELHGYLSSNYMLEPRGTLQSLADSPEHRFDFVTDQQVIGSRVHLNFAAQSWFLDRFFRPLPVRRLSVAS